MLVVVTGWLEHLFVQQACEWIGTHGWDAGELAWLGESVLVSRGLFKKSEGINANSVLGGLAFEATSKSAALAGVWGWCLG